MGIEQATEFLLCGALLLKLKVWEVTASTDSTKDGVPKLICGPLAINTPICDGREH